MSGLNNILLIIVIILSLVMASNAGSRMRQKTIYGSIILLASVVLLGSVNPILEHFDQSAQQTTGVNLSDIKCRRILEQAPNPPFVKIMGKAANTVESVQFIDNNQNMVESGVGTGGTDFSFQCPQGTDIVGYDMNAQGNERPDSSIFGGIGPVYCQDGTIIGKGVGKVKTSRIGVAPDTMLAKFTFVDSKTMPINNTGMGYMNGGTIEQCATVCDYLKDNCGGFTYDNAKKSCGLLYAVDTTKLQPNTDGRTYQKNAL